MPVKWLVLRPVLELDTPGGRDALVETKPLSLAREVRVDVSGGDAVPRGQWVVPNFLPPPFPSVARILAEGTAAGPLVLSVGFHTDSPSAELVLRALRLGTTPAAERRGAVAGTELRAGSDLVANPGLVSGQASL